MGNHSEKRSCSASFAQHQQQPVSMGGFHIKADWLHHLDWVIQSWDTASKPTNGADYSDGVTLGMYKQQIFVLDVIRVRADFPTLRGIII